MLIVGPQAERAASKAAKLAAMERIFHCEMALPIDMAALSRLLEEMAGADETYEHVIAGGNGAARQALAMLAARLGLPMLANISAIGESGEYERPVFSGGLIEKLRLAAGRKLLAISPAAFEPAGERRPPCPLEAIEPPPAASALGGSEGAVRMEQCEAIASDGRSLEGAEIVIGGGRGLGSKEGFARLDELADLLDAAIGASRVAVDSGWAPHASQICQTGVEIAPRLYLALGISGALQHMAGVKKAGLIAAINSDPEAPIFRDCDHGLVADLREALPQLLELLKERKEP
jgi:electron transfer flavoprotein alpha subunit